MRKAQPLVTPADLVQRVQPFVGRTFSDVAREQNVTFTNPNSKGCVGLFVEKLVGLPPAPDRLDYAWGDLKAKVRHANEKLGGCVIGSINSLAQEMLEDDVNFDEFILGKKIGQTVLVTVCTNRRAGGPAGEGWEKFTFESVSSHVLRDLPQWEGVKEDWEFLKSYVWKCALTGEFVTSSKKGPNDYLCFNSCGGAFKFGGHNLRRRGGLQLALGTTLVREICA